MTAPLWPDDDAPRIPDGQRSAPPRAHGPRADAEIAPGMAADASAAEASAAAAADVPPGLVLVAVRRLVEPAIVARIALAPGDRLHVGVGDHVAAGTVLATRLRDPAVREAGRVSRSARAAQPGDAPGPGRPWADARGHARDGAAGAAARGHVGEYLFEVGGRWRIVTGELTDAVEAPVGGRVAEIRPGMELILETVARGIPGAEVLGGPARGRLAVAGTPGGELRASSIDVGRVGAILVVGARIDAEALTRARAMGVRGVIVAGLPSKERRDFAASEARQRASRQSLPPFAVLVLDGVMRRPIPSPVMALLEALEGRDVGILSDPAALAIEETPGRLALPEPPPGLVRIRAGELAGTEGRWAGLGGRRRFPGGVDLEAGLVTLEAGDTVAVPLGDLECFA